MTMDVVETVIDQINLPFHEGILLFSNRCFVMKQNFQFIEKTMVIILHY